MKIAVIALGSNLGNSLENLRKAVARVGEIGEVVGVSGVYKTPPFFYEEQADFLNATLAVETSLDAFELLKFCKQVEADFGRKPTFRNAPRPIDLDIVFLEDEIVQTDILQIPHKDWQNRDFVKTPLIDLLELGIFEKSCFDFVKTKLNGVARAYKKCADL